MEKTLKSFTVINVVMLVSCSYLGFVIHLSFSIPSNTLYLSLGISLRGLATTDFLVNLLLILHCSDQPTENAAVKLLACMQKWLEI